MKILELNKNYDELHVLKSLQLEMEEHVCHGLLGANGAGKSTLIKVLMGLVFADEGQENQLAAMALLPENPYLPLNLTAYQIVSHACRAQQHRGEADDLLMEVRLKKDAWHKPIRTYSKGMKQRTAIAYALVGNPEWLILDEPMSGLDAMGRMQMLDVFERRKAANMSILMCSHSVTDLVRLCQKVHIMADGVICEVVEIKDHSMAEAESLEKRLKYWSADYVLD